MEVNQEFKLLYSMDPMCSWCYAFEKPLTELVQKHQLTIEWHLGGLAKDTDQPMPMEMRNRISGYWKIIEDKTGLYFNYDFWTKNTPRRSTFNACRAVLAASELKPNSEKEMVTAIQKAYYQRAMNPSDIEILVQLAEEIGIGKEVFENLIRSEKLDKKFQDQMTFARELAREGYPSLYLNRNEKMAVVSLGYCDAVELEDRFQQAKEKIH